MRGVGKYQCPVAHGGRHHQRPATTGLLFVAASAGRGIRPQTPLAQTIVKISRTADAMKEKKVPALEIKDQAALKAAIAGLRSFGMAAEEALEEKVFDQSLFKDVADAAEPVPEPEKPRAGRKQRKEQEAATADEPQE